MGATDISNFQEYNSRMAKSIMDKAFFIDKVDCDIIVDFGCANGDLLAFIAPMVDDGIQLIGYDIDETMCELAAEKLKNIDAKNEYDVYSDWNKLMAYLGSSEELINSRVCLVLSSVLHEVYHYSSPQEIERFWESIRYANFTNIVIRDMVPSRAIERQASINDVSALLKDKDVSIMLQDFENHYGSVMSNKNLVHFLMKYKYKEPNWAREVKENYFPVCYEELLTLIPDGYEIIYNNHYTLPYLYRTVKRDFGIEIEDNTHLQWILELN